MIKKHKNVVLTLIVTLIFGLALVNAVHFGKSQNSTTVSGLITSDTAWTKANSPYTLIGPVLVDSNITLVIEPGVVVYLDYELNVKGVLRAIGFGSENIIIVGGMNTYNGGPTVIGFYYGSIGWNEDARSGSIIENAVINGVDILVSQAKINNCTLNKGVININTGTSSIGPIISNNTLTSCRIECHSSNMSANINICDNIISRGGITVFSGSPKIQRNQIMNNSEGIAVNWESGMVYPCPIIQNNTIIYNDVGIKLAWATSTVIINNDIFDNTQYNIYMNSASQINATLNWWGTTNSTIIEQRIWDSRDYYGLGTVAYIPFLDGPFKIFAVPISDLTPTSIPGPTPTQTPTFSPSSPTPTPTQTPTSTSSLISTPTPVPTITPYNMSLLNLSCKSSTSYSNFRVEISGSLTAGSAGIPAVQVLISYSVNGGVSWIDLTTISTDASGKFMAVWAPSFSGNNLLKATWTGNLEYSGTSIVVSFAVAPFEEQSVFSVTSNSTLSEFSFDSANKKLSFGVAGPSETTGYVDVFIPKSLLNDVSTLSVYLDGNQVAFTADSQGDSWLVSLTYAHSTHNVVMNLNAASPASFIQSHLKELGIAGAAIAALAVAAGFLVLRKRKTTKKHTC
jgi:parallel beta-helix repeat protein